MAKIKRAKIHKGWYHTVGMKYGWLLKGHSQDGIGLNRDFFNDSDEIHVRVNGTYYRIYSDEALNFIKETKSWEKTPRGTKIGYVPHSMMEVI